MAANSPIISIGITRFLIRRSQVRILPGTPSSKSLCLGADHGQKRELGGVTITRGDLTSPGPLQKRTNSGHLGMSALCRFCCRSPLLAFANGDSVALTRFAAEASDDGAAEARAGAAFLRVSARRGDTGRSPCARDRRRARSDLGAC